MSKSISLFLYTHKVKKVGVNMAEIDRLEVQIHAQATKANNALDSLTSKLQVLSNSLSRINGSGLNGLANGVQRLGTAMQTMNNVRTADFSRLARNIERLGNINTSSLNSAASSMSHLTRSFNQLGTVSVNAQQVGELAKSISRFGSIDFSNLRNVDFTKLTSEIRELANGLSKTPEVSRNTISLINAVSKLASAGADTRLTANSLGYLAREMRTAVTTLSSVGSVSDNLISFTTAIGQLASAGARTGVTTRNLGTLAIELKKFMQTMASAPAVSNNVIQMTNALANLANQGGRVGSASNSIIRGLNNISTAMTRTKKNTLSLAAAFGKLYASYWLVIRGLKKMWSSIEGSMDYVETFNYFSVAMDKIGKEFGGQFKEYGYDSAEAYANSFSERLEELTTKMTGYSIGDNGELMSSNKIGLGLDPNQLMQFQAQVSSVTNSVGLIGETSVNVSKALSMLSSDMSSLFNMDLSSVMGNLQSGLIGQSRALYKYGIDITNATLQQYAYNYGIEKSVSKMNQAEKMQLRMLAILDQSKVAWGDQANTINSVANQWRIFKQQIANVGRTIGNLFLPIVQKVLPYVNGLIIAINKLLTSLGFKIHGGSWLKDIMDGISGGSAVDDLEGITDETEDMADGLDNASKSAKKLQGMLQKFDELNNISTQDSSSSGGSDSNKGSNSNIDLSGAIADSLADYESVWDKALKDSENKAETIANNIIGAFKKGDYKGIGTYISTGISNALKKINWKNAYNNARNFGTGLANFLNGLITPDLFGTLGNTVASTLNTALYALNSFGKTFDWKNFGISIATGINDFFKTFDFTTFADTINVWVRGALTSAITLLKETDFEEIGKKIGIFLSELDLSTYIPLLAELLWEAIKGAFDLVKGLFEEAPLETSLLLAFATLKFTGLGKLIATKIATSIAQAISAKLGGVGIATALKTAISTAWTSLGGLGGILTTDLGVIVGAGTFTEIALTVATGLVGAIAAAIGGFELGKIIGKALFPDDADYYNNFSWDDFFKTITSDFETSVEAWKMMFSDMWKPIIDNIFNFDTTLDLFDGASHWLGKISEDFKKNDWGAIGTDIVNGIIGGLLGAISFVTEPFSDLFAWIFDGICGVFGIHSPAKEMEPIGKNILLGIVEGFKDKVKEFDKAIKDWFNNGVKPWFTNKRWLDLYNTIKTALVEKWNEVTKYWDGKKALSEVKTTYENFKEKVKEKWKEVENYWNGKSALAKVKTTYENFKAKVEEKWKEVKKYWKDDKGVLEEVKTTYENFKSKVEEKWTDVTNYWDTERPGLSEITAGVSDLKGALKTKWEELKTWWDKNKPSLSEITANIKLPHLKVEWDTEGVAAKALQKLGLKGYPNFSVSYYAQGGFPEDGWFRANHGEIMGKFDNGQSVVANNRQITEGIAIAVNKGNQENNMLMRQEIALLQRQNELLVGILEKETGISSNDIFNSVRKSAREYSNRTGNPAFDY